VVIVNSVHFIPRHALQKRPLCRDKMSVCPSLSVTRRYCVEAAENIIKLFSPSGSSTILVFPYQTLWQYSDGDPLTGASNPGCMKNRDFRLIFIFVWEIIKIEP